MLAVQEKTLKKRHVVGRKLPDDDAWPELFVPPDPESGACREGDDARRTLETIVANAAGEYGATDLGMRGIKNLFHHHR